MSGLVIRALPFGVQIRAPDFWKLPHEYYLLWAIWSLREKALINLPFGMLGDFSDQVAKSRRVKYSTMVAQSPKGHYRYTTWDLAPLHLGSWTLGDCLTVIRKFLLLDALLGVPHVVA